MFGQLPSPTIFAHRGASAHAPENTLASFQLALEQHADAIELDAKLTADGEVVVIHDQTVDRTTEGTGRVGQMTLAQLRELDAGSFFDIAFHGEKIPKLAEVFETVGHKTFINVELTNYASLLDDLPEKVAKLVTLHNMEQHVLFSSFNPIALLKAHRLLPEVPIGLLADTGRSGLLARSWLGRLIPQQALHPEFRDVTPRLVDRVHRSGRRMYVYTVNDPGVMHSLIDWKVDGFFTDDPVLARKVLEAEKD